MIESRSDGSFPGSTSEGRFCSRDGGGVVAAVCKCRLDENDAGTTKTITTETCLDGHGLQCKAVSTDTKLFFINKIKG